MTFESRTYIGFDDILAVQFRCSHCGGILLFPLDRIDRHPDKCPNCNEQWFRDEKQKNSFYNSLDGFAATRKLVKELESRDDTGMRLSLEIKAA